MPPPPFNGWSPPLLTQPYKTRLSTPPPSHCPGVPPLSFPPLPSSTTITAIAKSATASETPLHCLLARGDPAVELVGPSFPSPAPWLELLGTEVARGRAPVSSHVQQWPPMNGGPVAPSSTARGLSPRIFPSKNNSRKSNFLIFLGKLTEKTLELQTFITFDPQLQIQ
jgi:hypothetical protein